MIFAALSELVMTHIFHRKNWMTLVQKICPKLQQIYKKGEGGLVRGWSFVGWKYWPCREKKLKIAMLNEAPFMVKFRFEKCKYCFANICAQLACFKYLYHSEVFNSSLFSLLSWLRNVHFVHYKYKMRWKSIWNIWMRIKWERNLSEIFGRG